MLGKTPVEETVMKVWAPKSNPFGRSKACLVYIKSGEGTPPYLFFTGARVGGLSPLSVPCSGFGASGSVPHSTLDFKMGVGVT